MKTKRIFKYSCPVPLVATFPVTMVRGAEVLCVQVQNGGPQLWAVIEDAEHQDEERVFVLRATGQSFDGSEGRYIGTFQLDGGLFVGHLFERSPLITAVA